MSDRALPLSFPCSFSIKILGEASKVEAAALPILHAHIPDFDEKNLSKRLSGNTQKFLSLTATFTANSQAQLDALYQALSKDKRVLMVL